MLDQQVWGDPVLGKHITDNYIPFRAISQEKEGKAVFEKFKVRGTPTLMAVNLFGEEIDRMVGYYPPAEDFVKKMDGLFKGENTFYALKKKLAEKPDDLQTAALLIEKYIVRRDYEACGKMRDIVLKQEKAAKELNIPVVSGQFEVSAYEAAKYSASYDNPEKVIAFEEEFPNSKLLDNAFRNLSRFLYRKETAEPAGKAYEKLFAKYPRNKALAEPYISYCANAKSDIDKALKIAESVYTFNIENENLAQDYAKLLILNGKKDKAVEIYGKDYYEAYIKESNAEGLNGFAWFWAVEGENLDNALTAAEKSIEMRDDANTWDTLSMVYWKIGKLEDAVKAEERALEMVGGKNEDFEQRIADIKKDMK